MKVIYNSETVSFSNSSTCEGIEFPFKDEDINIAVVTVDGRYPDKGHLMNEISKEIACVISGSGIVGVDEVEHALQPGDAVLIRPGERFFWQGDNLRMLMSCIPAFKPEQHKEVE